MTDYLIWYEAAVTKKVVDGLLNNWVTADPESGAIRLGVNATYAVRGVTRPGWNRQSSGGSNGSRDFSDWPRDVCWLYNNTHCYFKMCKRAHICRKIRAYQL